MRHLKGLSTRMAIRLRPSSALSTLLDFAGGSGTPAPRYACSRMSKNKSSTLPSASTSNTRTDFEGSPGTIVSERVPTCLMAPRSAVSIRCIAPSGGASRMYCIWKHTAAGWPVSQTIGHRCCDSSMADSMSAMCVSSISNPNAPLPSNPTMTTSISIGIVRLCCLSCKNWCACDVTCDRTTSPSRSQRRASLRASFRPDELPPG
mmetsp:Transcript_1747/g.4675  ORF Transcript_1747/g.4675 Transcript_1747/m.4675 type:complete len:205 (+) Transcript_1747:646-1260(+)